MAQITDIIGSTAQHNFEQRILRRVKELNMLEDFTSCKARPLLSFTLAELIIVANSLDTTVNWLLTGHQHSTSTPCEHEYLCERGTRIHKCN